MPCVTFQENEVSDVRAFESQNEELSQELFYQGADYIQFRADYRLFKAEQQRKKNLNRLSPKARFEQQMRQQAKMTPVSTRPSCTAPQFRRYRQPQGIALMA